MVEGLGGRLRLRSPQYAGEELPRASRIEMLGKAHEKPAYAAEVEVWRELLLNRVERYRVPNGVAVLTASFHAGPRESMGG